MTARTSRGLAVLFTALCLVGTAEAGAAQEEPRNIVLMIADGAGYNTFDAASMYQGRWNPGRKKGDGQVYGKAGWISVGKACWSLRGVPGPLGNEPGPERVYDPVKAWDATPVEGAAGGYEHHFQGYLWQKQTMPDSAATMTQMVTGVKTYNGAINVDGNLEPLNGFAVMAAESGRSVGVVSSVPWSHATPAAASGVCNNSRANYQAIANDMLSSPLIDVLVGAGHPAYDDDGHARPAEERYYRYVGGAETWSALAAGEHAQGWILVESRQDFDSLALNGRLPDGELPERLLGVPRAAQTLQQRRSGASAEEEPFSVPFNAAVPSLATLSLGALEVLDAGGAGFFVMIEGGAVDWAMHSNQMGRMIEEMIAFNDAVEAVVAWIEAHGGWEENLLILTADHDHMLCGPDGATEAFQPLQDRGPGEMPGHSWQSNSHSNHLVPLYARGAGAEHLFALADGEDPVRGAYIDDTEVFALMTAAWRMSPVEVGATR